MYFGRTDIGRGKNAQIGASFAAGRFAFAPGFQLMRIKDRGRARNPFVQEQVGGLQQWIGQETAA